MYRTVCRAMLTLAVCVALMAQTVFSSCATGVHLVMARGQGPGSNVNVLYQIQDDIEEHIPGSTTYALPYAHGSSDKMMAVHDGALMMQAYVEKYVELCPDSKIMLFGYSLGACLTMDAICGTSSVGLDPVLAIDTKYTANVIAVIVYGDETYFPFMPWDLGNCTVGSGLFPRLGSAVTCEPWKDALQSYCDQGDNECCIDVPQTDNAAHHTYFEKYDNDVVAFVKKRLIETS